MVMLTEDERAQLVAWSRRSNSANGLAMRSRIVLAAADGMGNTAIADKLDIHRQQRPQVASRGSWPSGSRVCWMSRGRVGRAVADEQVEAVITRRWRPRPGGHALVDTVDGPGLGMSQTTVSRVWRAFGLAPHEQDSWKLSRDPLFVDKVRDVVGLYLDPPERALVLCVDEKTQIQALDRTAAGAADAARHPARASHDYVRHGTSSLYAALDVATGKVIGALHARHRARSSWRS